MSALRQLPFSRTKGHRPLLLFIILALVISWGLWLPALWAAGQDEALSQAPFQALLTGLWLDAERPLSFLLLLGLYGPLLAAGVTIVLMSGRPNLAAYLRQIFNWRIDLGWYGLAFALPLVLNAAAIYLTSIITGETPPRAVVLVPSSLLLVYALWQILTYGLQEPAWRGFALPLLESRYSAEKATWIVGLLWAVWHYPLVIYLSWEQGLWGLLLNLAGFTLTSVGWSFVLTWMFNSSGSIWLLVLLQGWSNTVNAYQVGTLIHPLAPVIHAAVTWLLVFTLLRIYGGRLLTERAAY